VQKYKNIAIIVGVVIPVGLSNYLNNFSYPLHRFLHALQETNHLRRLIFNQSKGRFHSRNERP
jgi:hypothetical protein